MKNLKLGAKKNKGSQKTVVTVDNIRIGIDFVLIAGPCGVESEKQTIITAQKVKETGAKYCITVCHNCHSQMLDLNEHFDGGYYSVHLWTLIGLSLGILSEDEREYLCPELKEVNVLELKEEA